MKFPHKFFSICTILIVFFSFTLAYGAGPVTFSYAEEDSYGELTRQIVVLILVFLKDSVRREIINCFAKIMILKRIKIIMFYLNFQKMVLKLYTHTILGYVDCMAL